MVKKADKAIEACRDVETDREKVRVGERNKDTQNLSFLNEEQFYIQDAS